MRIWTALTVAALTAAITTACSDPPPTLAAANAAFNVLETRAIEFTGKGTWYQFGQAAGPTLPWPRFDVASYTATVDYSGPGARVQMRRTQAVEPGRLRPAPVEQRPDQYVGGLFAWNMALPPGAAPGTSPVPQAQPAAVEERTMEMWSTPHGFLWAAAAARATSAAAGDGLEVTFMFGKSHYVGTINARNQVEQIQTWIDNPVLGDTLVETRFADYRDFGGVLFPSRITRTQGGHPVLDLTVSAVKANPPVNIKVPDTVRTATVPPVEATAEPIAPGVYYIRGGSHHSVAIEQADHIVVVEGPQNEARSLAVIAKVKATIPAKPVKYLVNSHVHFDHSGGLRTWVDEGATIVTHQLNRPYYEQAWAAPHTLSPDRLFQSKKAAVFDTFTDRHVLTDGKRSIEVHRIAGNGHNDAFAMVYLPAEKILIEVDAWTPAAANAPPPAVPSPFAVNLHENIQRLKLDVRQIAALHGPRVTTLADLRAAIGLGGS